MMMWNKTRDPFQCQLIHIVQENARKKLQCLLSVGLSSAAYVCVSAAIISNIQLSYWSKIYVSHKMYVERN